MHENNHKYKGDIRLSSIKIHESSSFNALSNVCVFFIYEVREILICKTLRASARRNAETTVKSLRRRKLKCACPKWLDLGKMFLVFITEKKVSGFGPTSEHLKSLALCAPNALFALQFLRYSGTKCVKSVISRTWR